MPTMAYPCGVGPAAHHPGEDAVRRRRTPDQYRLRPGLDDHRSVPVGLSVGALPHHQGEHAARPAGQHSEFYPHLGWQAARRSCPRYALAGSRSHTSWIVATSTLPPLCVAPSRGLLRRVLEHRCRFGADGSLEAYLRPDSPWTASHPSDFRSRSRRGRTIASGAWIKLFGMGRDADRRLGLRQSDSLALICYSCSRTFGRDSC